MRKVDDLRAMLRGIEETRRTEGNRTGMSVETKKDVSRFGFRCGALCRHNDQRQVRLCQEEQQDDLVPRPFE